MQQIELYINDDRIELGVKTAFSYTKQWNDFRNISDRQASFTNKFVAPLTPANIAYFDQLGIVGNQSRTPYLANNVRLVVDGSTIVASGLAYITGIKRGFEIVVYDDNIHFYKTLGSKKLSELDLESLNHELTITNFTGSFAHTYLDGYIYAISNFGNFDPVHGIVVNYQLPSFFVRYIWEKIHNEAGFTFDFTPEDDLIITPARGYDSELDVVNDTINSTQHDFSNDGYIFLNYAPDQIVGTIALVNGIFTVNETAQHNIEIIFTPVYTYLSEGVYSVFVNGTVVEVFDIAANLTTFTFVTSLQLTATDAVWFTFNGAIQDNHIASTIKFGSFGTTGIYVNVSTFIGETSQANFIRDIMQHYALTSYKVKDEQTIKYKKAKDLLVSTGSEDWSDRNVVVVSEKFELRNYNQENRFAYSYLNPDERPYADGVMSINNQTLGSEERTQLTRPYFAPQVGKVELNNKHIKYTPFWEPVRDDNGKITEWKVIKAKNYFGRVLVRNNEKIKYKVADEHGTHTGTFDLPVIEFLGLSYYSLLQSNYQEINEMLNWNRILEVKLFMDFFDFDVINPFALKYIKSLGGYFFVNKIKISNKIVVANIIHIPL